MKEPLLLFVYRKFYQSLAHLCVPTPYVAIALDKLPGEKEAFYGHIMPTLQRDAEAKGHIE
jgi:hypothetical protein